jgi:hypothetical protein
MDDYDRCTIRFEIITGFAEVNLLGDMIRLLTKMENIPASVIIEH